MSQQPTNVFSVKKTIIPRFGHPSEIDLDNYAFKFRELKLNAGLIVMLEELDDLFKRQDLVAGDPDIFYKLVFNHSKTTFQKERPTTKSIISEGVDALEIAKITLTNRVARSMVINGEVIPALETAEFSLVQSSDEIEAAAQQVLPESQANQAVATVVQETVSEETKSMIKKVLPSSRKIIGVLGISALMGAGAWLMSMPSEPGNYGRKPEAIIGAIPLYSVQRIERAKSDRKVKYRAIGDVFLAHQQGTQDSLRIDGTFSGPFRYYYLWMLIWLQQKGESRTRNITLSNLGKGGIIQSRKAIEDATPTGKTKLLNYDVHKTFPIITDFSIMFNMYLQTIEWHREMSGGHEIIKYHLLFRKWVAPHSYKPWEPRYADGVNIASSKIKLDYWRPKSRAWIEYGIDLAYKMIQMGREIYFRMAIRADDKTKQEIDQEAVNGYNIDVQKSATSYAGRMHSII